MLLNGEHVTVLENILSEVVSRINGLGLDLEDATTPFRLATPPVGKSPNRQFTAARAPIPTTRGVDADALRVDLPRVGRRRPDQHTIAFCEFPHQAQQQFGLL
jgi:hypothetical protein